MLVVLKLDRLGRDNIDVQNTINLLINKGIKVVCLDLPVADLSKLGRPTADKITQSVQAKKAEGLSQSKTAEVLGLGIATVKRHWNKTASIT